MKNIFRIFAFIALVGIVFTSCQKDNLLEEKDIQQEKGESIAIDAEASYPILKGFVFKKYRYAYIPFNDNGDMEHKTMKIKDLQGRMQEWIFVDLKTDGFIDNWTQAGDDDGINHGMYYEWYDNFHDMTQANWDQIIFDEDFNNISGFHIPTQNDINKLAQIIGSTSKIRNFLKLGYDGAKNYVPDYSTDFAAMWVNKPGDPNIVAGCGVFGQWQRNQNDHFYYFYTNIQTLGVNVRLVRDLPANEW